MKCFYHNDVDAVGTCSQCGKGCCRECIEDIGGALLCKDCMSIAVQEVTEDKEKEVKKAKRSMIWQWVVTILISLFIAEVIFSQEEGVFAWGMFLFFIYATWATFWGWKLVWPWWKNFISGLGCFLIATPITWLLIIAIFFYIPLIGAYMYGVLGGGIYQYLKYRKIAKGTV
jgi:hypothetical protein